MVEQRQHGFVAGADPDRRFLSVATAELAREHNDANVLSMGERLIAEDLALQIVRIWLETGFDGGRHQRRVAMLNAM